MGENGWMDVTAIREAVVLDIFRLFYAKIMLLLKLLMVAHLF